MAYLFLSGQQKIVSAMVHSKWGCVRPDKLCLGCRDGDVAVNAESTANAKVFCPFLVCSVWQGWEGVLMPRALPGELG